MSSASKKPRRNDNDALNERASSNNDQDSSLNQSCAQRIIEAIRTNDTLRDGLPFFLRIALVRCAFAFVRLLVHLHTRWQKNRVSESPKAPYSKGQKNYLFRTTTA